MSVRKFQKGELPIQHVIDGTLVTGYFTFVSSRDFNIALDENPEYQGGSHIPLLGGPPSYFFLDKDNNPTKECIKSAKEELVFLWHRYKFQTEHKAEIEQLIQEHAEANAQRKAADEEILSISTKSLHKKFQAKEISRREHLDALKKRRNAKRDLQNIEWELSRKLVDLERKYYDDGQALGIRKKQNALFIHGYKGSGESGIGKSIVEARGKTQNFIIPNFNLEDVETTLSQIKKIILDNNVRYVYGTSLGAFYALAAWHELCKTKPRLHCTLINPCMKPSEEIPLLEKNSNKPISQKTIDAWKNLEDKIYSTPNENIFLTGYFADNDELFGTKYIELFKSLTFIEPVIFKGTNRPSTLL